MLSSDAIKSARPPRQPTPRAQPAGRPVAVCRPRRIPRELFALCSFYLAGLALLSLLQAGNGKTIPRLELFLGRFHPVVLQVSIGLILLALILEDEAKRAEVARLAAVVTGLQKRVPGSLCAIASGGRTWSFWRRWTPAHFGDAQLRELAAVADDIALLDLRRPAVADAGLAPLAKIKHLRRLQLRETNVTDAGLTDIKTLPDLEVLNLYVARPAVLP